MDSYLLLSIVTQQKTDFFKLSSWFCCCRGIFSNDKVEIVRINMNNWFPHLPIFLLSIVKILKHSIEFATIALVKVEPLCFRIRIWETCQQSRSCYCLYGRRNTRKTIYQGCLRKVLGKAIPNFSCLIHNSQRILLLYFMIEET